MGVTIRLKCIMAALRLPKPNDELMILKWRNSEAVAPYMLRDTVITPEEHQRWFEKIINDTDHELFRILEHEGITCGFVSLSQISLKVHSCEWGGYLSPDTPRGVGLGRTLMYLSIAIAFSHLGLDQIMVEVIVDNRAAINLYESMGFVRDKTIVNRAERQHGPADVIVMLLNQNDWNSLKDDFRSQLITRNLISE